MSCKRFLFRNWVSCGLAARLVRPASTDLSRRILQCGCAGYFLAACFWLLACLPAFAAPFAYVPEGVIAKVAVVDIANNTVVASIAVRVGPLGVAASPDGKRVYIVCQNAGQVSVIDTATNTVIGSIAVGHSPWSAVVSPDSSRVYVSNTSDNTLSVIDTSSNSVIAAIAAGIQPMGITITPDGSQLYVSNDSGPGITVVSTASNSVLGSITLSGATPNGIAMSPDGQRVYATGPSSNTIYAINTATRTVVGSIPLGSVVYPNGIVVSPDSSKVYATSLNGSSVIIIDAATLTISTTIAVGSRLYGINVAPDGSHVYAANFDAPAHLSVIDTSTKTVSATITLGGSSNVWAIGRFIAQPPLVAPGAPQLVSVIAGNAQATLTFNPPSFNGGSPITGYVAHCGSASVSSASSPIIVGGLSNGISYDCYLIASNAIGDSPASATLNITPFTIPDPPIITGLVAADQSVTISFSPSLDEGGSPITIYNAFCGFASSSATSPITINGLPNGVPVTCTMNALNAAGGGLASAPFGPVTPGIASSITSAALPNGSYGQSYSFTLTATGSPAPTFTVSSGALPAGLSLDSSSGVISGIPSSVVANISGMITANNNIGAPAAQAFSISIAAALADAPIIGMATAGNASVSVQFTPPAQTGGVAISAYTATCGISSNTGISSPIVVAGLANGSPVSCRVIATNLSGDSVPSAYSNSATPATLPDAPTIATIAAGDAQAAISFMVPAQDGGAAIIGYSASCAPGTHVVNGASSPLTMAGLNNGTLYSCSVQATNSVGSGADSASAQVTPRAPTDLAISISNGKNFLAGGMPTTYQIVINNLGPNAVTAAHVVDTLDTQFSQASWTCISTNGGLCPTASGNGNIEVLIDLPVGATVTLQLTATVLLVSETPVSNIVSVDVPNSVNDTNLANNVASDGPDLRGIFRNGFD
jgi:uncharacterized repeat protein (TIGR01451 family)